MTGIPVPIGGDGKVPAPGAARIRRTCASIKLLERYSEIAEAHGSAIVCALKLQFGYFDECVQILGPVFIPERIASGLGCSQRRKPHFTKSH